MNITFVTQREYPGLIQEYDAFIKLMESATITTYSKEHLALSRVRLTFTFAASPELLAEIQKRVSKLSFSKLTFYHETFGLKYCIADYLSTFLKCKFRVQEEIFQEYVEYTPIELETEDYLYYPENDLLRFTEVNLSLFEGKISLGSSDLVPYFMDRYHQELDVEKINGIYVIDTPEIADIENWTSELLEELDSLNSEGYVVLNENLSNLEILLKLLSLPVLYELEKGIITYANADIKQIMDVKSWVHENLINITLNKPMVITVTGDWQTRFDLDNNRLAQIEYITIMVLSKHPILRKYLETVKINTDGSILVPFVEIKDHYNLIGLLQDEIERIDDYMSVEVDDLSDALALRWLLYKLDRSSRSLIVSTGESQDFIFVVSNSKASMIEIQDGIDKSKISFKIKLAKYIQKHCQSEKDPISFNEFKEMTLEQLVGVIKPEKKVPYCYEALTLSKMDRSPVTRRYFKSWVDSIKDNPNLLTNGFLRLGYLPGIFDHPDEIIFEQSPPENIVLIQEKIPGITLLQIKFPDDTFKDLLQIDVDLDPKDFELIKEAWQRGVFLNEFGKITSKILGILSGDFLNLNPILYLGTGYNLSIAEVLNRIRDV